MNELFDNQWSEFDDMTQMTTNRRMTNVDKRTAIHRIEDELDPMYRLLEDCCSVPCVDQENKGWNRYDVTTHCVGYRYIAKFEDGVLRIRKIYSISI